MPPRGAGDDRLVGIELLRFAAAFGVLIWHYQNFLIGALDHPEFIRSSQPFWAVLAPLYSYGNAGVQLFWCISGFIFTWKYLAPINAGSVSLGRFLWLRFSRLYPLHLVTLLLVAALNAAYFAGHGSYFLYQVNDLRHFLLNLGFASYWGFQSDYSFNGPIWSVSVEILVYVLFFGLCRLWRGTLWTDIGVVIAASIAYAMLRRFGGIKLEVFGATTFFYIGAATCRIYAMLGAHRQGRVAFVLAGVVALSCLLVALGALKIAGASLALFPAAILLAQVAIRPRSERAVAAIAAVGNLTYASYLLHFPLQLALVLVLERAGVAAADWFHGPWLLLVYLALVLGLSALVFHGFERPAQNWLRRLGQAQRDAAV